MAVWTVRLELRGDDPRYSSPVTVKLLTVGLEHLHARLFVDDGSILLETTVRAPTADDAGALARRRIVEVLEGAGLEHGEADLLAVVAGQ